MLHNESIIVLTHCYYPFVLINVWILVICNKPLMCRTPSPCLLPSSPSSLQPRSKKRRPTFRRLLKTSGVKLENKLKNRQMKQQNVAKKQRKEQKKLRQAVKDAALRMPRPLETYRKRPGEHMLTEAKILFLEGRVGLLT